MIPWVCCKFLWTNIVQDEKKIFKMHIFSEICELRNILFQRVEMWIFFKAKVYSLSICKEALVWMIRRNLLLWIVEHLDVFLFSKWSNRHFCDGKSQSKIYLFPFICFSIHLHHVFLPIHLGSIFYLCSYSSIFYPL